MPAIAPALLASIGGTAIRGYERRTLCDPPWPCIDPYRDALPGQPLCRVDGEALDAATSIGVHRPQALPPTTEAPQTRGGSAPPAHPSPHVHRRPSALGALLMRPVPGGMQGCHARRVAARPLLHRARRCDRDVGQASWHLPRGLQKVLPGLAQRAGLGLALPRLAPGPRSVGAEHRAMVGDDALRAPLGRQGGTAPWQERGPLVRLRGHPRQHRACVACHKTEARDPATRQLAEIPPLH